jgi:hypothetical protein
MLEKRLAELASACGTALVTAMLSDGWDRLKPRYAYLLGRDDPRETVDAAARLEQSRVILIGLSGMALVQAKAEQEIVWRALLADLLERRPQAEDLLRALVQAQEHGSQHADHVHGGQEAEPWPAPPPEPFGQPDNDGAPARIEGQGGPPW